MNNLTLVYNLPLNVISKKEAAKIRKIVAWYNMIPNLFWSALNLVLISVFCYGQMDLKIFYIFLAVSLLTLFLPRSFFDNIQLGTTTSIYKKIGITYLNRFTQNGDIINSLIRRKFPQYKVISNRSIEGLLNQTYIFEKFHFMVFLFFTLATGYALMKGYLIWAFILVVTNVTYNVYPNFLQQYLRIRLTRLVKR